MYETSRNMGNNSSNSLGSTIGIRGVRCWKTSTKKLFALKGGMTDSLAILAVNAYETHRTEKNKCVKKKSLEKKSLAK